MLGMQLSEVARRSRRPSPRAPSGRDGSTAASDRRSAEFWCWKAASSSSMSPFMWKNVYGCAAGDERSWRWRRRLRQSPDGDARRGGRPLLEDLARFEQAYVGVAAIQVVADHVQQAGQQRRAHVSRFFAQRIGQGQRLACSIRSRLCLGGFPKVLASCSEMKVIEMALVVAEREHGLANLGVLRLVGQRRPLRRRTTAACWGTCCSRRCAPALPADRSRARRRDARWELTRTR